MCDEMMQSVGIFSPLLVRGKDRRARPCRVGGSHSIRITPGLVDSTDFVAQQSRGGRSVAVQAAQAVVEAFCRALQRHRAKASAEPKR